MSQSILYLEDELELAQEVIEELEDTGLKVIHCVDYHNAIIKADNQKFDLFIVDIHLKVGTGDKFIKTIKQNVRHINHNTPILVASSQLTEELVKYIGDDIDYAIVKPYNLFTLLSNISKILQKKR